MGVASQAGLWSKGKGLWIFLAGGGGVFLRTWDCEGGKRDRIERRQPPKSEGPFPQPSAVEQKWSQRLLSPRRPTLDMTDPSLHPVMHKELSLKCDPSLNPVTSLCLRLLFRV